MAIRTNISLSKTQKEYFQRFVNLSVNEEALVQGEGTIRISPFDDYFLFTMYDEIDNEDTPIDLSNVGDIFINFIGTSDQINIKNWTQVQEVDLSQGEVLFKISKDDSKKVLALNNNNFYISTKMVSVSDDSISDESILYQGTWLAFDAANQKRLSTQIEEQQLEYSKELGRLKEENDKIKLDNTDLLTAAGEDELAMQALQASNDEMVNEIAELTKDLKSSNFELINRRAKMAAASRQKNLRSRQQNKALQINSLPNGNKKAFFNAAAQNLQQYSIGITNVTPSKISKNSGYGDVSRRV